MLRKFQGQALTHPGGRVQVLDLAPGEERALEVQRSEDALLAALRGRLILEGWRPLRLAPGEVARVGRGRYRLKAPEGGRGLLVVFGLSPELLAQDHERLFKLLEALPNREAALALAQSFTLHATLEEALYYPTLSPGALKERLLEHRLLRELLGELLQAVREGRPTEGLAHRFRLALEAHAQAELEPPHGGL